MKIVGVETWAEAVPLIRPYAIASRTISDVTMHFVRVIGNDGTEGLGSASPAEEVTGESSSSCGTALAAEALDWLQGRDIRELLNLSRRLKAELVTTPAARGAVEMALFDLSARALDRPLVDLLGRCHQALPTSITIGIKADAQAALDEADEYIGRGFRALKVKIGRSFEEEIDLLRRLRARVGDEVLIRVDANLGYSLEETRELGTEVRQLDLELVEQPVTVPDFERLRRLPEHYRQRLAADESLLGEEDALALVQYPVACGIFNVKLMKCGGISSALAIAGFAETADVKLMWGCMDESVVSISAALHAAYSCPNTRYLDLDGSFDLARDPARGGFELVDGQLQLLDKPGLGVELVE